MPTMSKPQVYQGDYEYVFVSYAHADSAAVLPIIQALVDAGYRVWYDDGIEAGSSWPDYIANRLHDCAVFLPLISRASLDSDWCRNEVEYALARHKDTLPVYLEDVELPRALEMQLSRVQALFWHAFKTDDEFNEKLFSVKLLDRCLTPGGRRHRGVQPRDEA